MVSLLYRKDKTNEVTKAPLVSLTHVDKKNKKEPQQKNIMAKVAKTSDKTKTAPKKAEQPQTLDFAQEQPTQEQPTQEQTAPATPKTKWNKEEAALSYETFLFTRAKAPKNPAFLDQLWNKFCEVALNINPTAPRGKSVLDKQYYGIGRFTQFLCTLPTSEDRCTVEIRLDEESNVFAQFWSDMETVGMNAKQQGCP